MMVHPNKRQLKLKYNVYVKSIVRAKVSPSPFPYVCQALAQNDNRIWQLKSRSGGEKNFCFFQISNSLNTESLQRQTAVLPPHPVRFHWLSTVSRPNGFISLFHDIQTAFSSVSFQGEKTADDAWFSPTAWPTCPPSCSNTPEKRLQNVKYCACAKSNAFKEFRPKGNMLLFTNVSV